MSGESTEAQATVTWPRLLRVIWTTAAGVGGLALFVAAWDAWAVRQRMRRPVHLRGPYKGPEHLRVKAYRALHPSRSGIGRAVEVLAVLLGVGNFLLYMYETYKVDYNATAVVFTALFVGFFGLRYLLRLVVYHEAGRRLSFVLSADGLTDLIATINTALPLFSYIGTFFTLAYLRLITVYYAWATLDTYLEPAYLCTRVHRHLARMALLLTAFLACFACTVATVEIAGDPDTWNSVVDPPHSFTIFNGIYFALVSSTTVGYGDVTPVTLLGRLFTVIFIVAGIVLLSILTARLLEILSGQRAGAGACLNTSKQLLVLIVGETELSPLCDVLSELFHPEHAGARHFLHAVVLLDGNPQGGYKPQHRRYLAEHPVFTHTVTYLKGSVFSFVDIIRTAAHTREAQAAFILQRSGCVDDTRNLMRLLAIRRHLPNLPVYIVLGNSANRMHALAAGVPEDNVMVLAEVRAGLLSANVLTPGASTLLINLFSTDVATKGAGAKAREKARAAAAAAAGMLLQSQQQHPLQPQQPQPQQPVTQSEQRPLQAQPMRELARQTAPGTAAAGTSALQDTERAPLPSTRTTPGIMRDGQQQAYIGAGGPITMIRTFAEQVLGAVGTSRAAVSAADVARAPLGVEGGGGGGGDEAEEEMAAAPDDEATGAGAGTQGAERDLPLPPELLGLTWQDEYGAGIGQELLEVRTPAWLVGRPLLDAAILIYTSSIVRDLADEEEEQRKKLGHPLIIPAEGTGSGGATGGAAAGGVGSRRFSFSLLRGRHEPADQQPRSRFATAAELVQHLAARVSHYEDEGPVLIAVRHVSRRTGRIVIRSDFASHHVLKPQDSLFIIARDMSVLGHDVVSAGTRLLRMSRAAATGTAPDAVEAANAAASAERLQRFASEILAAQQRKPSQQGTPTEQRVSPAPAAPPTSPAGASAASVLHGHGPSEEEEEAAEAAEDDSGHEEANDEERKVPEGEGTVRESKGADDGSRSAGGEEEEEAADLEASIEAVQEDMGAPAPTATAAPHAPHSPSTPSCPGTSPQPSASPSSARPCRLCLLFDGSDHEQHIALAPPADVSQHIVIITQGDPTNLHLFLYPLRQVTGRPVVVLTPLGPDVWQKVVRDLQHRTRFAEPVATVLLHTAPHTFPVWQPPTPAAADESGEAGEGQGGRDSRASGIATPADPRPRSRRTSTAGSSLLEQPPPLRARLPGHVSSLSDLRGAGGRPRQQMAAPAAATAPPGLRLLGCRKTGSAGRDSGESSTRASSLWEMGPVYFVQGSPLLPADLVRTRIGAAQRVVILARRFGEAGTAAGDKEESQEGAELLNQSGLFAPLSVDSTSAIESDSVGVLTTMLIERRVRTIAPHLLYAVTTELVSDQSILLLGSSRLEALPAAEFTIEKQEEGQKGQQVQRTVSRTRRYAVGPSQLGEPGHGHGDGAPQPAPGAPTAAGPAPTAAAAAAPAPGEAAASPHYLWRQRSRRGPGWAPTLLPGPPPSPGNGRRRGTGTGAGAGAGNGGRLPRIRSLGSSGSPTSSVLSSYSEVEGELLMNGASGSGSDGDGHGHGHGGAGAGAAVGASEAEEEEKQPLTPIPPTQLLQPATRTRGGAPRPGVLPTADTALPPPSGGPKPSAATSRQAIHEHLVRSAAATGSGPLQGFKWSMRFAAGRIFPASAVHSLLVQAFYNPSLLRLLSTLQRGDRLRLTCIHVPPELLDNHCCEEERHRGRTTTRQLCQTTCTYAALVFHLLLRRHVVPLGIYREPRWLAASLPYVQTNPPMNAKVRCGDMIYAIVPVK